MQPLDLNIRFLRLLTLWPGDKLTTGFLVRHGCMVFIVTLFLVSSILGTVRQLNDLQDINILLDYVIGIVAYAAMVYMSECFIKNAGNVRQLVTEIASFHERFDAGVIVQETERNVQTVTKMVMLYGFVGNLCYSLFPLFNIPACETDRILEPALAKKRDPCGLIVRAWFPFDTDQTPWFQMAYAGQLYSCIFISMVVLALTLSLVGLLMHGVALIRDCRRRILASCNAEGNAKKRANVTICVRYHIAIILQTDCEPTDAFGTYKFMRKTHKSNIYRPVMVAHTQMFRVNIALMRLLNLWPPDNVQETRFWRNFKDVSAFLGSMPTLLTILADLVVQMQGRFDDVLDMTENMLALGAIFGMMYLAACFVQNRDRIKALITRLGDFEEFGTRRQIFETDRKSALYTKVFIFYGVSGLLCYFAVPYANMQACRERRAASKYSADIPCALITRCRWPFDYKDSWFLYVAVLIQAYACLATTMTTLAITMFIVSLMMQIITQLQHLRELLRQNAEVRHCIRYHTMIIEYAKHVTQAFSSMMLMHITLTSFEISVLGFEVLMVTSRTDSLRFGMHLLGWLVLLFLICSYGQKLIDESTGIGWDAYATNWYDSPVSVQKDLQLMILRSQKPLTLSAASLGVMSLETYLGVLSTAYSYFTLLLNMKD